MARKRPVLALTDFDSIPEEALIPGYQQPYEIPARWKWVPFGSVVQPSGDKMESFDGTEKYVGLENLGKGGGIIGYGDASTLRSVKSRFKPGQLLYGKLRPYLDKHAIVDFEGVCSTDILVYEESPLVDMRWLETWMSSALFIDQANAGTKGINLPRVSEKYLASTPFPLPPLDEQRAIVEKLQATNQKVDDVLERLDRFLAQAPQQRAGIIQAGVDGTLTKSWRAVNKVSWPGNASKGLFEFVTSGSRGWSKYYSDEGTAFLRMGNLTRETIDLDLSNLQRVALPEKVEGRRSQVSDGDLLISITADVGNVALVRDLNEDAYINQHLALARPASHVMPEFLAWYLKAPVGAENVRAKQRGATKTGLGLDDIRSLAVRLPTPDEQFEIVRRLNIELERHDQALARARDARTLLVQAQRAAINHALRGPL